MKLGGALTEVERDGTHLRCGGGARLPSAAAKAAGWGLSGLEFGINIPGTVGGAVRMNANAYGGQLAEVLEWVEVSTAAGTERRDPATLDFVYRNSNLGRGRDRLPRLLRAHPRRPRRDQRHARLDARPPPRGAALRDQDLRLDLQEPRRRARRGPLRRPAARGGRLPRPRHGGARFSEKHANFVENIGEATTADVLALMAEGRRRVKEEFGDRARARGPGAGRRRRAGVA